MGIYEIDTWTPLPPLKLLKELSCCGGMFRLNCLLFWMKSGSPWSASPPEFWCQLRQLRRSKLSDLGMSDLGSMLRFRNYFCRKKWQK
jgi:hypothetical protein